GEGVRLRRVPQGVGDRDPAPRRHRLHVGARPAPVLQARQIVGVHLRRRDVPSRAGRAADQSLMLRGDPRRSPLKLPWSRLERAGGSPVSAIHRPPRLPASRLERAGGSLVSAIHPPPKPPASRRQRARGPLAPAAVRELLEESGILLACDGHDHPLDAGVPAVAARIERCRTALMAGEAPFAELLARESWWVDLRGLRYLSHFITPRSSPIRFTARFFLCRAPVDQAPRLFTEETSEGFWIHPGHGYRRFLADEMKMAEPAEYGLAWLAQFESI